MKLDQFIQNRFKNSYDGPFSSRTLFYYSFPLSPCFQPPTILLAASSFQPTNTFSFSHLSDGLPPKSLPPSRSNSALLSLSSLSYHTSYYLAYYHLVSEFIDAALKKPPIVSGLPKPRCAF